MSTRELGIVTIENQTESSEHKPVDVYSEEDFKKLYDSENIPDVFFEGISVEEIASDGHTLHDLKRNIQGDWNSLRKIIPRHTDRPIHFLHSRRVGRLAYEVARRIPNISPEEVKIITLAALLHDIGKTNPDPDFQAAINSSEKIEPDDKEKRDMLGEHVGYGGQLLSMRGFADNIAYAAYLHHTPYSKLDKMRQNGDISEFQLLAISIIETVDIIDAAIATDRNFAPVKYPSNIYQEIMVNPNNQFNPAIHTAVKSFHTDQKDTLLHDIYTFSYQQRQPTAV